MKYSIITFLLLLLLVSCTQTEGETSNTNLRKQRTFGGAAETGFIARTNHISTDYKNYIYVADFPRNHIKQYDLSGEFIRDFGQQGSGPGEFRGGMLVTASDSLILVYDTPTFQVSFFDTTGDFKSSFRIERRHNSLLYMSDNYLVAGHAGAPFEPDLGGKHQFYKYDYSGNLISTFGNFPLTSNDQEYNPAFLFRNHMAVENDLLHVAYQFLPLYQIYDIASETLIAEYDLTEFENFQDMVSEELHNLDPANFQNKTNELKSNIWGFEVIDKTVIFLHGDPEGHFFLEKFSLQNNSLNHEITYSYPIKSLNTFGILDFLYVPDKNSFYLLDYNREYGVTVSIFEFEVDG